MTAADLAALAKAFDLSEADIEDAAEKIAGQVQQLAELWQANGQPEADALRGLRRVARRHHVALPQKDALGQLLNRMTAPAWWRGALRKRFRIVEQQEIARGAVHRQAAPYVSAKALRRHQRNAKRLAELLASLEAVNLDTGEALPLDELIATSQANPAMRRMAMMARIRGIETHATAKGDAALFVTLTAPSRMHPRHEAGHPNARHDGTTPRQAQAYLNGVWRAAMRSAARQGLTAYGLRTVEPHHDACPHWHMLMFTRAGHAAKLIQTIRTYGLADSPTEPGAAEHRVTVEFIDQAKGSAAAYVAKYVAKSIDGHGVGDDTESDDDGATASARIVAWSRLWGIRQFQFFGLPPITPTRELYRHSGQGLACQALDAAHQACKAKDYAGYLHTLEAHALRLGVDYEERPSSRYAGELAHAVHGLLASGADLQAPRAIVTRSERWCIQARPAQALAAGVASPWTRFNNCAPLDKSTTCERSTNAVRADHGRATNEGRRRRPPTTAGPLFAAV
ncbi:Bacteriophage replication gene A protein [Rubrivivax sp. A210]|uniref:replication endonuclease n=1 Tax=Rubrivivax sp. A210 TaxID=2772301 RepID=UPI00191B3889|nr:replication endonuclease [Rubrivivax sp. A210]CAD5374694.1 Bacteriophage replication gene A protein [Rubrivivax sp. A210]